MSPSAAETAPLPRRARYRQATIEEIKRLALRQLADQGPGTLSLRAIARDMGTASSALYRYFATSQDLISALCADAYCAAADALETACAAQPIEDSTRRWWAICHALRQWSLGYPAEFALIFGTPVPGHHAPPEVTGPGAARFLSVLFRAFDAAVQTGAAHPDRTQVPAEVAAGELLQDLIDRSAPGFSPQRAALVLNALTSVLGYLAMEVFGSLPRLIADPDQLFAAHVRTVMLGLGFDLDAVQNL